MASAPGVAGVRVWSVMSRGWGHGRPLPEAMVLKEARSNSQMSHYIPTSEGLVVQDGIDAAIQTTSTSKVRRVAFGGCGPSQPWTITGWRTQMPLTPFAYPDFTHECRPGMATAQSCRAASITIEMFTRSPR